MSWPKVETVKKRQPGWWALPEKDVVPTRLFMLYVINERFISCMSNKAIASDRCFHRLFPFNENQVELLCALLNSTMAVFLIQILGRSGLGLGALKFEAMDAKRIQIFNPKLIPTSVQSKIVSAFEKVSNRSMGSIFEEIGANSPDEVSLKKIQPDRRELDKIIMGDILGLTEEEQLEVYKAVVDLVRSRIEKAKSVEKGKKYIEGVDVEAVAGTVAKQYKEKMRK